jgi:hypothetical protein
MKYISIALGLIAIIFMAVGIIPCLGSLNYINLLFSVPGSIIALWLYLTPDGKVDNTVKIALFLNGCAVIVGIARLFLGGGVI